MTDNRGLLFMSKFVELFTCYGYAVQQVGEKSYIADNGFYCIPFTELNRGCFSEITAMSFLSYDKEEIKQRYDAEKHIGYSIWSDYMQGVLRIMPYGTLCRRDLTLYEVERWLQANSK